MTLAVGYATATPDAVAGFVAAHWPVAPVTRCAFASRGFNDIYRVEAGERYVLRLSGRRARGPSDVDDETLFLAHLHDAGVPVAAAVRTRGGGLHATAELPEGPRAAVLFHAIEGRMPGLDSAPDARAQGATLAALHDAAERYGGAGAFALDADRLMHRPLEAVRALDLGAAEAEAALGALAGRLVLRLEEAAPRLTRTRLHGDCHGLNARIDAAGRAVFFDFDDGGRGWLAYDLAVHLWAQVSFGRTRQAIWHAFIEGYRAARPIVAPDLDAVELFVPMRHLWLMGEYAGMTARWGDEALTAAWLAREVAFLLGWEAERLAPPLLGRPVRAARVAAIASPAAAPPPALRREWPA